MLRMHETRSVGHTCSGAGHEWGAAGTKGPGEAGAAERRLFSGSTFRDVACGARSTTKNLKLAKRVCDRFVIVINSRL